MKAWVCELCGSNDLIKQDGCFVCQHCGTKYSAEEARKMMIDGPVDVSGSTVKIDHSQRVENLYVIARRAIAEHNFQQAAKYYEMIQLDDASNWEPVFYLLYCRGMGSSISDMKDTCRGMIHGLSTVLDLIDQRIEDKEMQEKAVEEVAAKCHHLSSKIFQTAYNRLYKQNGSLLAQIDQDKLSACAAAGEIMLQLGDMMNQHFDYMPQLYAVITGAWKAGIQKYGKLMGDGRFRHAYKSTLKIYESRIKKYEPTYQLPSTITGGCYIASAVYGSYDCPQVWVLRRFRDQVLVSHSLGRCFIKLYYAVSPHIVEKFGGSSHFARCVRRALDSLVSKLQKEGFSHTPYAD